MAVNSLPDITYINKYIQDGNQSKLSLKNFYETLLVTSQDDPDDKFRVPFSDFFIKYRDQLAVAESIYVLPQTMFYKPKMVSFELYGTTEMWLALLRLNGFRNVSEFHYPLIKIYNKGRLMELLNIFFKREGIV